MQNVDTVVDIETELNKIKTNKYGVVNAILAIDKPKWVMAYELVAEVRQRLGTRSVGHAGALDPFATGVMIILVGKKYTRQSDYFLKWNKTYKMRMVFGTITPSLDVETEINRYDSGFNNIDMDKLKNILTEFEGGYNQQVPLYSSVKVNGQKLRVLVRGSKDYKIYQLDKRQMVRFTNFNGKDYEFEVPVKNIKLNNIKLLGTGTISELDFDNLSIKAGEFPIHELAYADILFSCSKGTYARQFAADIANRLGTFGFLIELQRISIGSITVDDCIKLEDVNYPEPQVF